MIDQNEQRRRTWKKLIRFLRQWFPVETPVAVIRRPIKRGDTGFTRFDGRTYLIRVKSNQDWDGQVDTLLHEWAHVLAIEEAYNHSGSWSQAFGNVYETYCRDFTA